MIAYDKVDKALSVAEKQYIQSITASYKTAFQTVSDELAKVYIKYGVEGKLTPDVMAGLTTFQKSKITRLEALQKQIGKTLSDLTAGQEGEMATYLTDVYAKAFQIGAEEIAKGVSQSLDFGLVNRQAVYDSAINPMTKIRLQASAEAVKENIRFEITQGIIKGDSIQTLTKAIQTALGANGNNAVRIARTESTGMAGKATLDLMKKADEEFGLKSYKVWIAKRDNRVRESHEEIDGETVPKDMPFSNGLMYCGDQSGDPSEVINCRCKIATVFEEELSESDKVLIGSGSSFKFY
jgi:SPP1 gp7 family putative phage head morphogenesis protein